MPRNQIFDCLNVPMNILTRKQIRDRYAPMFECEFVTFCVKTDRLYGGGEMEAQNRSCIFFESLFDGPPTSSPSCTARQSEFQIMNVKRSPSPKYSRSLYRPIRIQSTERRRKRRWVISKKPFVEFLICPTWAEPTTENMKTCPSQNNK